MDDVSKAALLSALRTILGVASGALVTQGLLTQDVANQLIGAVMALIPLIWGVIDKKLSESKTQARVADAVEQARADITFPPVTVNGGKP